jgi:hypothetical protein
MLVSRGSGRTGTELRAAVALAAVRAAVEVDALAEEPRLLLRRHGDRLLVALEVSENDAPDTPAAPALLDYADALGKAADRLADSEVLPSPATVLRTLAAVSGPGGAADAMDERRRVMLAAVASQRAAAAARLEIYPRVLAPVRALRLAQAGVVPPASAPDQRRSLTPVHVAERVAARFPELAPLPGHPGLDRLLAEAGLELRWDRDRYIPPPPRAGSSSMSIVQRRPSGPIPANRWTAESPELAAALRAEEQLSGAGSVGGFRALTVRLSRYGPARDELTRRLGVRPVNVAACFLTHLHALVDARPKPTWETVLSADIAEPGSRPAIKLGEYVDEAWQLATPAVRQELRRDDGPVLLCTTPRCSPATGRWIACSSWRTPPGAGPATCGCSARWRTRHYCPSSTARWCESATTSGSPCPTPGWSTPTAPSPPLDRYPSTPLPLPLIGRRSAP